MSHLLMCSTPLDLVRGPGEETRWRDLPDLSLEFSIDLKSTVSVIFTKEVSYLCTYGC